MPVSVDIIGDRFGRLVAIQATTQRSGTSVVWECVCDCGTVVFVNINNLRKGRTKSCGCFRKEFPLTHSLSRSRIYRLWVAMVRRATKVEDYPNHAGRGISMCPEWKDFSAFHRDMADGYSDEATLDRIDVDGNYTKENCRWTTLSLQAFNKRLDARNTSGKTGVRLDEKSGKWEAKIGKDSKSIWLGRFDSFEDAVAAREEAEIKYFGCNKQ